jgi:hypothetical protein
LVVTKRRRDLLKHSCARRRYSSALLATSKPLRLVADERRERRLVQIRTLAKFTLSKRGCERPVNEMVTKMVTNTGPRADIERDEMARPAMFPNTNQHLWGQNKTSRNGYQHISSAVLSTTQRTLHGCKEIYLV